jgi:hypothetical protein
MASFYEMMRDGQIDLFPDKAEHIFWASEQFGKGLAWAMGYANDGFDNNQTFAIEVMEKYGKMLDTAELIVAQCNLMSPQEFDALVADGVKHGYKLHSQAS